MKYEISYVDFEEYAQLRDEMMAEYVKPRIQYTFHRSKKLEEVYEGWETHYICIISRTYHFDDLMSSELGQQSIRIIAPHGVKMQEIEWDLCQYQPAIYQMLTGIRLY